MSVLEMEFFIIFLSKYKILKLKKMLKLKYLKGLIKGRRLDKALKTIDIKNVESEVPQITEILADILKTKQPKGRTSLKLLERRPSKISALEKAGMPKGTRNQPTKETIPISTEFESPNIPTQVLYADETTGRLKEMQLSRLKALKNEGKYDSFYTFMNDLEKGNSEIIPELKTSEYITAARNYYGNMGIDLRPYSDETVAKLLTLNYNLLLANLSGALKGKVLWHGSGFGYFDTLDAGKAGQYTGNQGLYGNGFYLTNYPNNYGLHYKLAADNSHVFENYSLPFLVNGITEIGGNPRSVENSFGLMWHQPEGNVTVPVNYVSNYFKAGDVPGISEGFHWNRRTKNGEFVFAPKDFKGYNVKEGKFSANNGEWQTVKEGTGYKVAVGNNSWLQQKPGRAFLSRLTINSEGPMSPRLIESYELNGTVYPATEIVVPYTTPTKSLFPHPSTIILNEDGTLSIVRDWADARLNYKNGGKIKKESD